MAIKVATEFEDELSPYTFLDIQEVTGLTNPQDQVELIQNISADFPQFWELLGKKVKACMKNVTWANQPNLNVTVRDTARYHETSNTTSFKRYKRALISRNFFDGYQAEYCILSSAGPQLAFFGILPNGVFHQDVNLFSPQNNCGVDAVREYESNIVDSSDLSKEVCVQE